MSRRRIEFDAHDGSYYAQALNQLDAYAKSHADGQQAVAAAAANRAQQASQQLADQALIAAAEQHTSRRELADELGVVHGTVNYRIKRAHARTHGENEED